MARPGGSVPEQQALATHVETTQATNRLNPFRGQLRAALLHLVTRAFTEAMENNRKRRKISDFVKAKLFERDQRHLRFGDTRYVLEPNIKDGKGGAATYESVLRSVGEPSVVVHAHARAHMFMPTSTSIPHAHARSTCACTACMHRRASASSASSRSRGGGNSVKKAASAKLEPMVSQKLKKGLSRR